MLIASVAPRPVLYDSPAVRVPGDYDRKWISDNYFDLIVWLDAAGSIHGFQLLYDRDTDPKALTYRINEGLTSHALDDGEDSPSKNQTPVFDTLAAYDRAALLAEFQRRGTSLPRRIYRFVFNVLKSDSPRPPGRRPFWAWAAIGGLLIGLLWARSEPSVHSGEETGD